QAVAEVLELRAVAGESLAEQVRAFLLTRQTLLVLDNFEHVLSAAPELTLLLATCPQLRALVTSREPLRVDGEQELLIEPLVDGAAVELFMRRARAAYPALNAAAEDLAVVEAICQRVDRLPLAIELAAVWAKILPLPMLLERLFSRLEMLTGGRRDAPERQRTLRDTIAWSEQLLGSSERQLFGRLAIFMDGCTAEAAEAVCGAARESTAEAGGGGSRAVSPGPGRVV